MGNKTEELKKKMNKIIQGGALIELKKLPEKSVNMVMTSPPYWALRDYGVEGQFGLEPTFDLYIKHLCNIFVEVKRVLRDDGTCWVNLGDTYYGSGKGAGGDINNSKEIWTWKDKEKKICQHCGKEFLGWKFQSFCGPACSGVDNTPRTIKGKMSDKCMTLIPFRFAIEMVNHGWVLRNVIVWHKPNCMPSSVKDRFTVDFEYLFFFSKKKKYYFDTQYEPIAEISKKDRRKDKGGFEYHGKREGVKGIQNRMCGINSKGRNKRTVWSICPKPFSEAHFAVYPEELCETPIKAGCPEFVCVKCDNPKVAIYEKETESRDVEWHDEKYGENDEAGKRLGRLQPQKSVYNESKFKGYKPTCKCNVGFTSGIVLDPFFGSGTTGVVALKQGKQFIGIELNLEYIKIAKKRLKPYLEQEKLPTIANQTKQNNKEEKPKPA